MGSTPTTSDPGEISDPPPPSSLTFDDFQRQASLMTSCTLLWKELSDHFTALEQNLQKKSESLKHKLHSLDQHTQLSLNSLSKRESTISKSVKVTLEILENKKKTALKALENGDDGVEEVVDGDDESGVLVKLRSFCLVMDAVSFWGFVVGRKKEIEVLRKQVPVALGECVDPAGFVLEVISEVFPVDKRDEQEKGGDLGWACVLVLESLVPVIVDPVIGKERVLVTPSVRERAIEIAETWKRSLEERGGVENVKTPDVHTFLQHLVTFRIVKKEDVGLYWKLVIASAWRKQMPKLAVSLGLGDKMPELIEELISRHQQLDAVHFTYEVGLVDKFPPVPLLKAYLKDAKKAAATILEDPDNSGRAAQLAVRKEQSALRAVIKCIEEYKLEAEFPPENLKKRLEQLEKAKTEKKKKAATAAGPASKRTRVSNGGGLMPPAKAGRSTNAYVSSFPTPPTFLRSPSHTQYPAGYPAYPSPPHSYGSGSPQSTPYSNGSGSPQSTPYAYSPEAVSPLPGSYPGVPVNYPVYGGYGNGMSPAYQQAYYR